MDVSELKHEIAVDDRLWLIRWYRFLYGKNAPMDFCHLFWGTLVSIIPGVAIGLALPVVWPTAMLGRWVQRHPPRFAPVVDAMALLVWPVQRYLVALTTTDGARQQECRHLELLAAQTADPPAYGQWDVDLRQWFDSVSTPRPRRPVRRRTWSFSPMPPRQRRAVVRMTRAVAKVAGALGSVLGLALGAAAGMVGAVLLGLGRALGFAYGRWAKAARHAAAMAVPLMRGGLWKAVDGAAWCGVRWVMMVRAVRYRRGLIAAGVRVRARPVGRALALAARPLGRAVVLLARALWWALRPLLTLLELALTWGVVVLAVLASAALVVFVGGISLVALVVPVAWLVGKYTPPPARRALASGLRAAGRATGGGLYAVARALYVTGRVVTWPLRPLGRAVAIAAEACFVGLALGLLWLLTRALVDPARTTGRATKRVGLTSAQVFYQGYRAVKVNTCPRVVVRKGD